MTVDQLNYCLSRFILEVKKQNGEEYPSETLYEMIVSIQLYLAMNGTKLKLLSDDKFSPIRNVLDNKMKENAAAGYHRKNRKAEVISQDDEEHMWQKGILGSDSPKKLVDTLIYMIGLHFAPRAVKEHKNLRFVNSQLSVGDKNSRKYLEYVEDVAKNNQGGLKHRST